MRLRARLNLKSVRRHGPSAPRLITQPPSLFWPINTAQSYNIAQHVTGPGPITYTTADALPAGVTLSSAGVLSGTPTTIVTGFIGVVATAPNGSTLVIPVYLAIRGWVIDGSEVQQAPEGPTVIWTVNGSAVSYIEV